MVNHLEFGYDVAARTMTLLGREYSLATLLRTITFLGAYLLLRPYMLKLSAKFQALDHDREVGDDADGDSMAATGKTALRPDEMDSDGEETGWGAKARRRAREEMKRLEEEEGKAEEDEDEQLNALLED
ncbi:hypothetical protein BZA05DRAFT_157527 [Tricharina praecox]|uniref:uncharacterized protein n=1 Tax=Tricharina praecox TaxID=43433 RepID=UPI002220D6B1|nr:uncharacterized protein BZA05DRAFT_157527 [Tricharina praecox]KAI5844772.1 hypothetical protein BZA05DRAFT_157527 [Tricharina praecox]